MNRKSATIGMLIVFGTLGFVAGRLSIEVYPTKNMEEEYVWREISLYSTNLKGPEVMREAFRQYFYLEETQKTIAGGPEGLIELAKKIEKELLVSSKP